MIQLAILVTATIETIDENGCDGLRVLLCLARLAASSGMVLIGQTLTLSIGHAQEGDLGVAGLAELVDHFAHCENRFIKRSIAHAKSFREHQVALRLIHGARTNAIRNKKKPTEGSSELAIVHVRIIDLDEAECTENHMTALSSRASGKMANMIGECHCLFRRPIHRGIAGLRVVGHAVANGIGARWHGAIRSLRRVHLIETLFCPLVVHGVEEEDFSRNTNAAAELKNATDLLNNIDKHGRHRTRPIEEDHDAVILLITLESDAVKDILAELVLAELAS